MLATFLGAASESAGDLATVLYRAAIVLGVLAGVLAITNGARWALAASRESARGGTQERVGRRSARDALTNRLRESGGLMNQRQGRPGAEPLGVPRAGLVRRDLRRDPAQRLQRRRRHRKYLRATSEEHNEWLGRLDKWRDRLRDVIGRL